MKNSLLPILFVIGFFTASAQVGINNTNPDPSSALDIKSTNSGILIPRMNIAERNAISSPATGLMIFQTDNSPGFYYFEGTWKPFSGESHWIANGENIYNANTENVGIGTSTPTAKLHIDAGEIAAPIFEQGFESGLAPFTTSGDANWTTQSSYPHSGSKSARSGAINNWQNTSMEYTVTVPAGGATLSFWYKVSSEAGYTDFLFFIDNAEQDRWTGEVGYSKFTKFLNPGPHVLRWTYVKGNAWVVGEDAAFIDDVTLTATNNSAALRLEDGNQAAGKVLISDAIGNATWQELSNESIVDLPLLAAFGGMKIPTCDNAFIDQTDTFVIPIRGVSTTVRWKIIQRTTTTGSTHNVGTPENPVYVLKAPNNAERLQVDYTFNPPLPFEPKGLIFSANNNSNYPDTFSLNYAFKSQERIRMNITRNDKFGDTSSQCWQGEFYFDVFLMN